MIAMDLVARFIQLCERAGLSGDVRAVGGWLVARYAEPHRAYHDLRHIVACLDELDRVRSSCVDADAVEVALWFHDCIYDPTRGDNEERSAAAAADQLAALGAGSAWLDTVRDLILETRHAGQPASGDGAITRDIDLVVFAGPRKAFENYERAIRREYGQVSDLAFACGRARVLESFLARASVFGTAAFRDRYEGRARVNLARSHAQWSERCLAAPDVS